MSRKHRDRVAFEHKVFLMALLVALPSTAAAIILIFVYGETTRLQWTITIVLVLFWLAMAGAVREKVVFPLRTISNLLAALHEGDFSFRARPTHQDDALSEVMIQLNAIVDTLRDQRSSALEATALLRKVMGEIDVAIFAFDANRKLKLINRAGERLIGKPAERVMGLAAADLGLEEFLMETAPTSVRSSFPGASGVWGIRRGEFRERGAPHSLLVIADLTRPLREEELVAWQRLVRVLGHEINNSLTPVKSISESLTKLVTTDPLPDDWREDTTRGLEIISSRADALNRFTGAYARLARHPAPVIQAVRVRDWITRTVALETRVKAEVHEGEDVVIPGDPDQLDQLLINLLRNAVDATLGAVTVDWKVSAGSLTVSVIDEGLGIANSANLFVPFFTTKPNGSGIGLVLSRQIAEAHGGSLTLTNRTDRQGAIAQLTLPRRPTGYEARP
jgi:nitrogen fixation/metabolism regulation signal transduction histidine kinase